MIGRGLKTYAAELGLTVSSGLAYGVYRDYMLTLREGAGWKAVGISVAIGDETTQQTLSEVLSDQTYRTEYRIQTVNITPVLVEVIFLDNPGTMKRLKAALEIILNKIVDCQIPGVDCCSYCQQPCEPENRRIVKIGEYVHCLHDACVQPLSAQLTAEETDHRQGSIGKGILGASVGALLGAIPWAVVSFMGWLASILGFVIGLAAKKGYELLGGKESKAKVFIVIIATMLAVVLAEYAALYMECLRVFAEEPLLASFTPDMVFNSMNEMLLSESEVFGPMVGDILLGWLFAGLGIWETVRQIFTDVKPTQVMYLDNRSN